MTVPLVVLTASVCLWATDAAAQERAESRGRQCAVAVDDFDISGVKAVSESQLRAVLETKERRWLGSRKHCFDAAVFQADLKRIETFYAQQGYPDARIVEHQVEREGNDVDLRVVVDEGEPVRAAAIRFTGFDVLARRRVDALRRAAPLQTGDTVAAARVGETAQLAASALGDAGYPHAAIDVRQKVVAPKELELEFHAEPGEVGYFGPIDITGAVNVDDEVVRRELAYRPGERFALSAIVESRRRLEALELFESIEIALAESTPNAAEVPTRISVKERDFSRFSYSAGYGSEAQLDAELGWRHVNFLGDARVVSLRGRWSWLDRGGEGAFLQRYLFTRKLSLEARAFAWQVDEPVFEALTRGANAALTYRWSSSSALEGRYVHRFDDIRLSDDVRNAGDARALVPALGLDPRSGKQTGLVSSFVIGAVRDTTREALVPRNGSRVSLLAERAGGWLPGVFDFSSAAGDARAYSSFGRTTFAARAQYGSIVPAHDPSDLPFSRRYFLGGADTLRGWGRLEVSPLSPSGAPIGGQSFFLTNGELRVSLTRRLGGVLFLDAGNVWRRSWDLRLSDLRYDAGAGARYQSPFGFIRLDAAYQLTPIRGLRLAGDRQDRRWRLHLSAGHVF